MAVNTKDLIMGKSKSLFAKNGYEGFSIRILAKESGVGLSSIYHFFNDKDEILKSVFDTTNTDLGIKRSKLIESNSASQMLYDRIVFQFNNIENVVFVLKYYLHFRNKFKNTGDGYVPSKAYLHIEEVLKVGIENHEFNINPKNIEKEAKVITHAINGFLLEYYPEKPKKKDLDNIVSPIHNFIIRSLTNNKK